MKMYILIKSSVPIGNAIVAAAHASLAGYLKFKDHSDVAAWLSGPFRKVVCKVDDKQFEDAKVVEDNVVLTESSLGGQEVAIAFRPRDNWPESFKFFALYRSSY